jgi:hypothetical protein
MDRDQLLAGKGKAGRSHQSHHRSGLTLARQPGPRAPVQAASPTGTRAPHMWHMVATGKVTLNMVLNGDGRRTGGTTTAQDGRKELDGATKDPDAATKEPDETKSSAPGAGDPGLEGIVPRARPEEAVVGQAGEPETEQRATAVEEEVERIQIRPLTGPAAESGKAALA